MLRSPLAVFCVLWLSAPLTSADDWPQWMGPQRDGVWRETGIIEKFPSSGPKILWRASIGGGYAGPAVVGDRVYVTDKLLPSDVRNPDDPFKRDPVDASERVLCLSTKDGSVLWKDEYPCRYTVSYPAGPRTTPVVADGRVYALGAEGDLRCLDAVTGDLKWSRKLKQDYHLDPTPVWGFSSNPLLDGDRLICLVGGAGSGVVAFDKHTGKEAWRALDGKGPHGSGYSSPIIVDYGGRRQLIVFLTDALSSLDPETGEVFWREPFESREGLSVVTPRFDQGRLLVTSFYTGAMLVKLDPNRPAEEVLWRRHGENEKQTDALHSIISTPVLDGDIIYGADSYGEFRGVDARNGDRLWMTFEPTSGRSARWGTAFIVRQGDRYLLFSEQGDLIFARLSRESYQEISRAHVLEPTGPSQRREVVWSHPAYANRCAYARNDKEIVCVSLAAE